MRSFCVELVFEDASVAWCISAAEHCIQVLIWIWLFWQHNKTRLFSTENDCTWSVNTYQVTQRKMAFCFHSVQTKWERYTATDIGRQKDWRMERKDRAHSLASQIQRMAKVFVTKTGLQVNLFCETLQKVAKNYIYISYSSEHIELH